MPEDFAGPNLIPRASCGVGVGRKRGSVRLRVREREWEKDGEVKESDGGIDRRPRQRRLESSSLPPPGRLDVAISDIENEQGHWNGGHKQHPPHLPSHLAKICIRAPLILPQIKHFRGLIF